MILIRHYHQMTCKHKGIFNLLEMKSNLFPDFVIVSPKSPRQRV